MFLLLPSLGIHVYLYMLFLGINNLIYWRLDMLCFISVFIEVCSCITHEKYFKLTSNI